MTLLDVSQKLFGSKGNSYDSQSLGGSDNADASVVYGEAVVDASSGEVSVLIDGTAIDNDPDSPDYQMGDYITCDTDELIQAGDRVTVVRNGQNAKAIVLSPTSTGAAAAQQAADEAKAVAEATGQHFWHRSTDPDGDGAGTGAFVTDEEQDDFLTAAASGFADYDPSTKPYRNVLMNSLGFLIREALHNLASFTQSAVSFFDGSGNVTASFGASGAVIGKVDDGYSRTEIADSGMKVTQRLSGGSEIDFANLGYGLGYDDQGQLIKNPYYTFGTRKTGSSIGNFSTAEGYNVTASGAYSHAEGHSTKSTGNYSHAEGGSSDATGDYSHAEGGGLATGNYSHAEGDSQATKAYAHAEGKTTKAYGDYSHAEGYYTTANKNSSHAQNYYTYAGSAYQTAMGKYNVADSADTYALIIGNGTASNARSNAFTVAWNGDTTAAGEVIDGYGNKLSDVAPITPADTSWAYLVGDSGSTNYVRWRCKSGWVSLEVRYGSSASIPTSGSKTFGTIPSGYRPTKEVTVPCYHSSNNTGCVWVTTAGVAQAVTRASSAQATCYATLSYPLD